MRGRRLGWIVGSVLVGLLLVGGIATAAMAAAGNGPGWWPHSMMGGYGPYGPNVTPGAYGPGGMMPGHGPGGMMPGYGPGGYGQTPTTGTPATGTNLVSIQNFAFQPANLQVKAGTTVTWTNQDTAAHTVTFRDGTKGSGLLQQGQSFSYTFASPGTFAYYCAAHPNMVGQVIVTS